VCLEVGDEREARKPFEKAGLDAHRERQRKAREYQKAREKGKGPGSPGWAHDLGFQRSCPGPDQGRTLRRPRTRSDARSCAKVRGRPHARPRPSGKTAGERGKSRRKGTGEGPAHVTQRNVKEVKIPSFKTASSLKLEPETSRRNLSLGNKQARK